MNLNGWLPIYAYRRDKQLMLDWCYTAGKRFTEPFFPDTVDQICWDYGVRMFRHQTTVEDAKTWLVTNPGMNPSGFIFHMSRCGSTLVSQMLAGLPQNRVLSEPAALHEPIRAALLDREVSKDRAVDWLRTIVGALGRPLPGESHYFLKLDCWHVLALPLLVAAFPSTPWVFLYRDPAEVLVSQLKTAGAWTVPSALAPGVFGLDREEAGTTCEYRAWALAKMCEAAWNHRDTGRGMFVNYDQLPEAACGELLRHFGVAYQPSDVARMREIAKGDAKTQLPFEDDRIRKRSAVTESIQSAVDKLLTPAFERLEEVRRGSPILR